jgi:hypothetical protein
MTFEVRNPQYEVGGSDVNVIDTADEGFLFAL